MTRDLEEVGEVAHHGPEDLFIAIMTFVGAFFLMLNLHVELALVTALIVPGTVAIVSIYGGRMTRTWQEIYGRIGAFSACTVNATPASRAARCGAMAGSKASGLTSA